jgi:hypothetical protein
MTVLNQRFWSEHFRRVFIPQIHALVNALSERPLPAFANIEAEAHQKTNEEFERLGSLSARDDIDVAALAEKAVETGLAHYQTMSGLRQGLQNMFAAALYQLYEQQVMLFHRKEVLDLREENDACLFNHQVFRDRLLQHGIALRSLPCWPLIDELRMVANTVKHAEGISATNLHSLRPHLFVAPSVAGFAFLGSKPVARVFQPLMGEDLYVSLDDIRRYANAVEQFWSELADAMTPV